MPAEGSFDIDIQPALDEIDKLGQEFDKITGGLGDDIAKQLGDAFDSASTDFTKVFNDVADEFGKTLSDVFDKLISDLGDSFTTLFDDVASTFSDDFSAATDDLRSNLFDAFDEVSNRASDNFVDVTNQLGDDLVRATTDAADTTQTAFDTAFSDSATSFTTDIDTAVAAATANPLGFTVDGDVIDTEITAATTAATNAPLEFTVNTDVIVADIQAAVDAASGIEVDIGVNTDAIDASLTDAFDSSDIAASSEGVRSSLEGVNNELENGVNLTETMGIAAGGAEGNFGGMLKAIAPGVAVFGGVSAAVGFLVGEANKAAVAGKRINDVFGESKAVFDSITVGKLNLSLDDLAIKTGTTTTALQSVVASFGQTGISSGATADNVAHASSTLAGMAAALQAANPQLGTTDQIFQRLTLGFQRGGRILSQYGIQLTRTQIVQEALRETGKKAAGELTTYELTVAGATLAQGQLNAKMDAFGNNINTPTEKLKSLKVQIEETFAKVGAPLVDTFVNIATILTPIGEQIITIFANIFNAVLPLVTGVAQGLAAAFGPLGTVLKGIFDPLKPVFTAVGESLGALIGVGAEVIGTFVQIGASFLKVASPFLVPFFHGVTEGIRSLGDVAKDVADFFSSNFSGVFSSFTSGPLKGLLDQFGQIAGVVAGGVVAFLALSKVFGILGGFIAPLTRLFHDVEGNITALGKALRFAFIENPVIGIIALLAIGMFALYENSKPVRDAIDDLGRTISREFGPILTELGTFITNDFIPALQILATVAIEGVVAAIKGWIVILTDVLIPGIKIAVTAVADFVTGVSNAFESLRGRIENSGVGTVIDTVRSAIENVDVVLGTLNGKGFSADLGWNAQREQARQLGEQLVALRDTVAPVFDAIRAHVQHVTGDVHDLSDALLLAGALLSGGLIGAEVFAQLKDLDDQIGILTLFFANAGNAAGVFVDTMSSAFTGDVLPAIGGFITQLGDSFQQLSPKINEAFGNVQVLFGAIGAALSPLLLGLQNLVNFLGEELSPAARALATSIGIIVSTAVDQATVVVAIFTDALSFLLDAFNGITELLQGDFGGAMRNFGLAIGDVGSIIENAFLLVRIVVEQAINAVVAAFALFSGTITAAANTVEDTLGQFNVTLETVRINVQNFVNSAIDAIGSLPVEVLKVFEALPEALVHATGDFDKLLVQSGVDLITGMINGSNDALNSFLDFLLGLPDDIRTAVGDTTTMLLQAGADLIRGFEQGVRSRVGQLLATLDDAFGNLPSFIGNLLGIASPSTITHSQGEDFIQGFVDGILSGGAAIQGAVEATFGGAVGFAESVVNRLKAVASTVSEALSGSGLFSTDRAGASGLITTISAAITSLDLFVPVVEGTGVALDLLDNAFSSVRGAVDGVLGLFRQLALDFITVETAGAAFLGFLATMPQAIATGLTEGLVRVVESLIAAPEQVLTSSADRLVQQGRDFLQGFIDGFVGLASVRLDQFLGFFRELPREIAGVLGIASPSTIMAAQGRDFLQGFIDGVTGLGDSVLQAVINVFSGLGAAVAGLIHDALTPGAQAFHDFNDSLGTNANSSIGQLIEVFFLFGSAIDQTTGLLTAWSTEARSAFDVIGTVLNTFRDEVLTFINIEAAVAAFVSFVVTIPAIIANGLSAGALEIVKGLVDEPQRLLAGSGDRLVADGRDFVNGFLKGFTESSTAAIEGIVGFFTDIPGRIASILGIASPSTIMAAMGRDFIAGFIAGVSEQDVIQPVIDLFSGLGASIVSVIREAVNPGIVAFHDLMDTLGTNANSSIGQFIEIFFIFGSALDQTTGLITAWATEAEAAFSTVVDAVHNFTTAVRETIDLETIIGGVLTFLATVPAILANSLGAGMVAVVRGLVEEPQRFLDSSADRLVQSGRDFLQGFVNGFVTAASSSLNRIVDFFSGLPDEIASILGIASPSTIMAAMGRDFVLGFINGVVATARGLVTTVIGAFSGLVDQVAGITTAIGDAFTSGITDQAASFVSEVESSFSGVFDFFATLPDRIASSVGSFGDLLSAQGQQVIVGFLSGIQTRAVDVTAFFATLPGVITSSIGNFASLLVAQGAQLMDGLRFGLASGVDAVRSVVINAMSDLGGILRQRGVEIIQGLANGISSQLNTVYSIVASIPDQIVNFFGNSGDRLTSVGHDLIQGLINGIKDAAQSIPDKIGSVFDDVISFIGDALGTHSPSTITYQQGRDVMQGLINGINDGKPDVVGVVTDFVTAAYNALYAGKLTFQQGLLNVVDTGNLAPKLEKSGQVIKDHFIKLASDMAKPFEEKVPAIKDIIASIGQDDSIFGFVVKFQDKINQVKGFVDGIAAAVTAGTPATADAIGQLGTDAGSKLAQNLAAATPEVRANFEAMLVAGQEQLQTARQKILEVLPAYKDAGRDLAASLGDGVTGNLHVGDITLAKLGEASIAIAADPTLPTAGLVVGGRVTSAFNSNLLFGGVAQSTIDKASALMRFDQSLPAGSRVLGGSASQQFLTALKLAGATQEQLDAAGKAFDNNTTKEKAGGSGKEHGRRYGEGIKAGYGEKHGDVEDGARKLAQAGVDAGIAQIKAKSPSQVTKNQIGKPMGEGIAKGIEETTAAVKAAISKLLTDALGGGKKDDGKSNSIASSFVDGIVTGITAGAGRIGEAARTVVGSLSGGLGGIDAGINVGSNYAGGLAEGIRSREGEVRNAAESIVTGLNGGLGAIISGNNIGQNYVGGIAAGIIAGNVTVRAAAEAIIGPLNGGLGAIDAGRNVGGNYANGLAAGITANEAAVRGSVVGIVTRLNGGVGAIESGTNVGTNYDTGLSAGIAFGEAGVRATATGMITRLNGGLGAIESGINIGVNFDSGVGLGIIQLAGAVGSVVNSLVRNQLGGHAGEAHSSGVDVGRSFDDGVGLGIIERAPAVKSIASQLVRDTAATMAAAAQSKSPSRLTALIGHDLSAGLALGMTETANLVGTAAQNLVFQATSVVAPELAARNNIGSPIANGIIAGIRAGVPAMQAALVDGVSSTAPALSNALAGVKDFVQQQDVQASIVTTLEPVVNDLVTRSLQSAAIPITTQAVAGTISTGSAAAASSGSAVHIGQLSFDVKVGSVSEGSDADKVGTTIGKAAASSFIEAIGGTSEQEVDAIVRAI